MKTTGTTLNNFQQLTQMSTTSYDKLMKNIKDMQRNHTISIPSKNVLMSRTFKPLSVKTLDDELEWKIK